jgi:phage repressor protein C with HTH and peptisase S24 domain
MASAADRHRDAIRRFMTHRLLKIQPWCVDARVAESTLRNFLAGRSEALTSATLERLAAAADSSVSELLGERPREGATRAAVPVKGIRVEARMGEGLIVSDESEGDPFYFRREWLRSVVHAAPDALRVINLSGDSMEPTMSDGDVALVRLQTYIMPPRTGIYCIVNSDGEDLRVKRLEAVSGAPPRIRIISDNRAYDAREVERGEITILGPVIWRGGLV